jgi:hypothetical protein
MDGSLNFIPAVSAQAVEISYPVTERLQLTSYRRARVDEMYRQENPVTVFLRESNTLTSAIYRRNADDSIFVFFTDDAMVARPLFGAVNLVVGIAASAVGWSRCPWTEAPRCGPVSRERCSACPSSSSRTSARAPSSTSGEKAFRSP